MSETQNQEGKTKKGFFKRLFSAMPRLFKSSNAGSSEDEEVNLNNITFEIIPQGEEHKDKCTVGDCDSTSSYTSLSNYRPRANSDSNDCVSVSAETSSDFSEISDDMGSFYEHNRYDPEAETEEDEHVEEIEEDEYLENGSPKTTSGPQEDLRKSNGSQSCNKIKKALRDKRPSKRL